MRTPQQFCLLRMVHRVDLFFKFDDWVVFNALCIRQIPIFVRKSGRIFASINVVKLEVFRVPGLLSLVDLLVNHRFRRSSTCSWHLLMMKASWLMLHHLVVKMSWMIKLRLRLRLRSDSMMFFFVNDCWPVEISWWNQVLMGILAVFVIRMCM